MESASREAYVLTSAQVFLGQGRLASPLLKNVAREGTLCLAPMAFEQNAQSALQVLFHVLGT